ncbi:hypothetical protein ACIBG6_05695 [Streptomyces sp. NPDC050842]|uniref:hypothetical protein n=1 Tax=Streptomyces sp. NPDC050842 TaxID=3365636 RepID=UPI0037A0325D
MGWALYSQSERWFADVRHAMAATAWQRLVRNGGTGPDSPAFSPTVLGSRTVYVLWLLTAVVLAVVVVRRRGV